MGFPQALSGLNAAAKNLDVIGNNVANSNTVGFKSSQLQFGDLFANALNSSSSGQVGVGTAVLGVVSQFTQGNITPTNNPLDMAIQGNGFFRLHDPGTGSVTYTRNGQFSLDKNGFIVTTTGLNLTGYTAANGVVTTGALTNLQISQATFPAMATQDQGGTSGLILGANLNASDTTVPTWAYPAAGSAPNTTVYNYSTSAKVYDSQGQVHTVNTYFVKQPLPVTNAWTAYTYIDNVAADPAQTAANVTAIVTAGSTAGGATAAQATTIATAAATAAAAGGATQASIDTAITTAATGAGLTAAQAANIVSVSNASGLTPIGGTNLAATVLNFNTSGAIVTTGAGAPSNLTKSVTALQLGTGAATLTFSIDFSKMSQYGTGYGVYAVTPNGYGAGQLTSYSIGGDGKITGKYSNGQTQVLGQVVLGTFPNQDGLRSVGANQYAESPSSGQALVGPPGSGTLGSIQSSSTESSNVDLTSALVDMMTAQRAYQANIQTIKTQDQLLQAMVSLR